MLKISRKDKVANASVLEQVKKERKKNVEYNMIMKTEMAGTHFRNEVLLQEITEGRMKGKVFWGRKWLHIMSDLASSATSLEVKVQQNIEKDGI